MDMPVRRNFAFWVTAFVGPASLIAASATAAAGSTAGPRPRHAAPAAALASPSDAGASDVTNLGGSGWKVQSSATATQTGAQISTPNFNTSTWLPVTNDDAGAP